ncbi:MAG: hypothetical protein R3E46_14700 [Sedimenticolaceae bacterium]
MSPATATTRACRAFRPISQFSHTLLQQGLQEQCDSCHGGPGDALHLKIEGNCAQCHTQQAWLPATFEHEVLPLRPAP